MALQSIINIDIDFYDKKYILINAKQFDKNSRFISVTCYNHGEPCSINSKEYSAYIRYKKPDGYSVFNFCEITNRGKILVELTEQMLVSDGMCCADLVVVDKGKAKIDAETGEITGIDSASILSTMSFHILVSETAVDNSEIESSYEFDAFNKALEAVNNDYTEVILAAKSWAVGETGMRDDEDVDNAKYYCSESEKNAQSSKEIFDELMPIHEYVQEAEGNIIAIEKSVGENLDTVETLTASIEEKYDDVMMAAARVDNTSIALTNGMKRVEDAAKYAEDRAHAAGRFYVQTQAIVDGLNGAFLPKGTITYSELTVLKENGAVAAGYLYNISDNFITDETFRMGAGVEYEAGTNVYYTADGYWDCLAGATVTGVKGVNEEIYRKGNVELSAENVGAIPTTDIATIDEIKTYLGI